MGGTHRPSPNLHPHISRQPCISNSPAVARTMSCITNYKNLHREKFQISGYDEIYRCRWFDSASTKDVCKLEVYLDSIGLDVALYPNRLVVLDLHLEVNKGIVGYRRKKNKS